LTVKRETSRLSSSAVPASPWAEAAISCADAEVCSVEADTSSADAEDSSATEATSATSFSARWASAAICSTAAAI
jgi:hypothetical protein